MRRGLLGIHVATDKIDQNHGVDNQMLITNRVLNNF